MVKALLDRDYFNSIDLTSIKRKYYDVTAVDSILVDIRIKANEMNKELARLQSQVASQAAEIEQLRQSVRESENNKLELGNAVISAHAAYNEIVERANAEAEKIISEANSQKEAAEKQAQESQNLALNKIEEFYSAVKSGYENQIDMLNELWQKFLCGLDDEKTAPSDLSEKVGRIASEIREIDSIGE